MTVPTIPTDVRAAASAIEAQMAKDDNAPDDLARAALAAADKARLESAGDVVDWLHGLNRRRSDSLMGTLRRMSDAATLITTLQARLAAVEAERDAARVACAELRGNQRLCELAVEKAIAERDVLARRVPVVKRETVAKILTTKIKASLERNNGQIIGIRIDVLDAENAILALIPEARDE